MKAPSQCNYDDINKHSTTVDIINKSTQRIRLSNNEIQNMMDETCCHDNLPGVPSSTFPQKLFAMSIQEFDQGDVIHWLPHGLAFKVVDSDKFSEEVIPKYFKRKFIGSLC